MAPMKLVIAVVQGQDIAAVRRVLPAAGFRMTLVDSLGGFLRESNITLLIGADEARLPDLWRLLREHCLTRSEFISPFQPSYGPGDVFLPRPVEVQVGGATVWVLDVERFVNL
ncbi:MAG TPA: cyclic-di-AMP receptor [Chloroflexia bacterium]|nr:cyclic-di-AMP receptor [Chloroflexia bacterium]